MDADDRDLFERSLRSATERHTGVALDAALAEIGWAEALAIEPEMAVSVLFELQGSSGATSRALDIVFEDALGFDEPVLLPALGSAAPPGRLEGDRLVVAGLMLGDATVAVVVVDDHHAVRVNTAELTVRSVQGIDASLGLLEVTGEVTGVRVDDDAPAWPGAVARAQVALGHELVGASRAMLAMARQHALERVQFGRTIAGFQAVRHRLADTLVAIETAAAVLDASWLDGSPLTAAMGKAVAGRSARTATRHCQQVLAGIGFTTEHDFHRYLRRTLVLDQLFGSARTLTRQLGDDLVATRELPALVPL